PAAGGPRGSPRRWPRQHAGGSAGLAAGKCGRGVGDVWVDGCVGEEPDLTHPPIHLYSPLCLTTNGVLMIIEATAPTRIDLAGGTLDIYPLYLFEEGGITVNIGIDVVSRVRVSTRADDAVSIRSVDTGLEERAPSLDQLAFGGPLDLCARILRFYRPATGVDV